MALSEGIFKIKETRFIMKTKFILPIVALGLFAACNDDSSSSPVSPVTDTPAVTDSSAVTDPTVDPSVNPNGDPATDPSVNPGTDSGLTDSTANPGTETPATFDPTASVAACRNASRTIVEPTYEVVPTGESFKYYGAELSGKQQFLYGRFEACMKMVSFSGTVSSMFLYYDPSYKKGTTPWNEVDIEVIGTSPLAWQSNIITREGDASIENNTTSEKMHDYGFDATQDFHLYAIVWTPEYVAWEIDGVEIRRDIVGGQTHGRHADKDQVAFLTETETLRFNRWSSESEAWVGPFDVEQLANAPKAQWIDFVKVYSYDAATSAFTPLWQDDFDGDALDATRWSAGNWAMENVMLAKKNVVVEDGYCKLLLTRADAPAAQ